VVSLGRVLFSFLQSLGYSVVSLVGDFFFFFCSLSAVSRKGDGGRRVEERERGVAYTFGLANCFSIPGIRLSGERER